VATALLSGVLAGPANAIPTATADEHNLDVSDRGVSAEFLEDQLERFDVPHRLRPKLTKKILAGTPLDAEIPGAQPVDKSIITNDLGTYPITRFADGSFVSGGIEDFADLGGSPVQPRAVTGCARTGFSGGYTYSNCKVVHSTASHSMWFYANFSTASGAGAISSVWGRQFESSMTCTIDSFGITRKYATATETAKATFWMTCNSAPFAGSQTEYLGLRVKGSSYYSVQSF